MVIVEFAGPVTVPLIVSPRAVDLPGNGRDEDCQGGDAKLRVKAEPTNAANTGASARAGIPRDLNVLFVTIDTLRADLGYLGNPRPLSPNLDALAAQSVVFERAYSLASYTGKSMGPLMIGKYSSEVDGGFSHFNKYSKKETFVQERLQAAGIRTLSVQGYWYFFKDAGFERGFDLIDSSAAPKVASVEGDQSSNSDEQSDAAIKLLASPELEHRRFFMWMHFVDPHAEYAPHPRSASDQGICGYLILRQAQDDSLGGPDPPLTPLSLHQPPPSA